MSCQAKKHTPCGGSATLCLYCGIDLCTAHAERHRCRKMILSGSRKGHGHLGIALDGPPAERRPRDRTIVEDMVLRGEL